MSDIFPEDVYDDINRFSSHLSRSNTSFNDFLSSLHSVGQGMRGLGDNLNSSSTIFSDSVNRFAYNAQGGLNGLNSTLSDRFGHSPWQHFGGNLSGIMGTGNIHPALVAKMNEQNFRQFKPTNAAGHVYKSLMGDLNKNVLQLGHTLNPLSFGQYALMFGASFPAQMKVAESLTSPVTSTYTQFEGIRKFSTGFMGISDSIDGFAQQLQESPFQKYENLYQSKILLSSALGGERKSDVALKNALQMAREYPVRADQVLSSLTRLAVYPQVKPHLQNDNFQRKLMETVSGLSLIVPEQGLQGAMFSLVEAMSGSWRSLQMRFNVSPEVVQSLAGMTKGEMSSDPSKLITGLHRFVSKAVGLDVLDKQKYTFTKQVDNFGDALQMVTKNVFESTGLYQSATGAATAFQTGFSVLGENKEFLNYIGGIFQPYQTRIDAAVANFAGLDIGTYQSLPMGQVVSLMEKNFNELSMDEIGDRFTNLIDNMGSVQKDTTNRIDGIIYKQFGTTLGNIGGDLFSVAGKGFSKLAISTIHGIGTNIIENPQETITTLGAMGMSIGVPLLTAQVGAAGVNRAIETNMIGRAMNWVDIARYGRSNLRDGYELNDARKAELLAAQKSGRSTVEATNIGHAATFASADGRALTQYNMSKYLLEYADKLKEVEVDVNIDDINKIAKDENVDAWGGAKKIHSIVSNNGQIRSGETPLDYINDVLKNIQGEAGVNFFGDGAGDIGTGSVTTRRTAQYYKSSAEQIKALKDIGYTDDSIKMMRLSSVLKTISNQEDANYYSGGSKNLKNGNLLKKGSPLYEELTRMLTYGEVNYTNLLRGGDSDELLNFQDRVREAQHGYYKYDRTTKQQGFAKKALDSHELPFRIDENEMGYIVGDEIDEGTKDRLAARAKKFDYFLDSSDIGHGKRFRNESEKIVSLFDYRAGGQQNIYARNLIREMLNYSGSGSEISSKGVLAFTEMDDIKRTFDAIGSFDNSNAIFNNIDIDTFKSAMYSEVSSASNITEIPQSVQNLSQSQQFDEQLKVANTSEDFNVLQSGIAKQNNRLTSGAATMNKNDAFNTVLRSVIGGRIHDTMHQEGLTLRRTSLSVSKIYELLSNGNLQIKSNLLQTILNGSGVDSEGLARVESSSEDAKIIRQLAGFDYADSLVNNKSLNKFARMIQDIGSIKDYGVKLTNSDSIKALNIGADETIKLGELFDIPNKTYRINGFSGLVESLGSHGSQVPILRTNAAVTELLSNKGIQSDLINNAQANGVSDSVIRGLNRWRNLTKLSQQFGKTTGSIGRALAGVDIAASGYGGYRIGKAMTGDSVGGVIGMLSGGALASGVMAAGVKKAGGFIPFANAIVKTKGIIDTGVAGRVINVAGYGAALPALSSTLIATASYLERKKHDKEQLDYYNNMLIAGSSNINIADRSRAYDIAKKTRDENASKRGFENIKEHPFLLGGLALGTVAAVAMGQGIPAIAGMGLGALGTGIELYQEGAGREDKEASSMVKLLSGLSNVISQQKDSIDKDKKELASIQYKGQLVGSTIDDTKRAIQLQGDIKDSSELMKIQTNQSKYMVDIMGASKNVATSVNMEEQSVSNEQFSSRGNTIRKKIYTNKLTGEVVSDSFGLSTRAKEITGGLLQGTQQAGLINYAKANKAETDFSTDEKKEAAVSQFLAFNTSRANIQGLTQEEYDKSISEGDISSVAVKSHLQGVAGSLKAGTDYFFAAAKGLNVNNASQVAVMGSAMKSFMQQIPDLSMLSSEDRLDFVAKSAGSLSKIVSFADRMSQISTNRSERDLYSSVYSIGRLQLGNMGLDLPNEILSNYSSADEFAKSKVKNYNPTGTSEAAIKSKYEYNRYRQIYNEISSSELSGQLSAVLGFDSVHENKQIKRRMEIAGGDPVIRKQLEDRKRIVAEFNKYKSDAIEFSEALKYTNPNDKNITIDNATPEQIQTAKNQLKLNKPDNAFFQKDSMENFQQLQVELETSDRSIGNVFNMTRDILESKLNNSLEKSSKAINLFSNSLGNSENRSDFQRVFSSEVATMLGAIRSMKVTGEEQVSVAENKFKELAKNPALEKLFNASGVYSARDLASYDGLGNSGLERIISNNKTANIIDSKTLEELQSAQALYSRGRKDIGYSAEVEQTTIPKQLQKAAFKTSSLGNDRFGGIFNTFMRHNTKGKRALFKAASLEMAETYQRFLNAESPEDKLRFLEMYDTQFKATQARFGKGHKTISNMVERMGEFSSQDMKEGGNFVTRSLMSLTNNKVFNGTLNKLGINNHNTHDTSSKVKDSQYKTEQLIEGAIYSNVMNANLRSGSGLGEVYRRTNKPTGEIEYTNLDSNGNVMGRGVHANNATTRTTGVSNGSGSTVVNTTGDVNVTNGRQGMHKSSNNIIPIATTITGGGSHQVAGMPQSGQIIYNGYRQKIPYHGKNSYTSLPELGVVVGNNKVNTFGHITNNSRLAEMIVYDNDTSMPANGNLISHTTTQKDESGNTIFEGTSISDFRSGKTAVARNGEILKTQNMELIKSVDLNRQYNSESGNTTITTENTYKDKDGKLYTETTDRVYDNNMLSSKGRIYRGKTDEFFDKDGKLLGTTVSVNDIIASYDSTGKLIGQGRNAGNIGTVVDQGNILRDNTSSSQGYASIDYKSNFLTETIEKLRNDGIKVRSTTHYNPLSTDTRKEEISANNIDIKGEKIVDSTTQKDNEAYYSEFDEQKKGKINDQIRSTDEYRDALSRYRENNSKNLSEEKLDQLSLYVAKAKLGKTGELDEWSSEYEGQRERQVLDQKRKDRNQGSITELKALQGEDVSFNDIIAQAVKDDVIYQSENGNGVNIPTVKQLMELGVSSPKDAVDIISDINRTMVSGANGISKNGDDNIANCRIGEGNQVTNNDSNFAQEIMDNVGGMLEFGTDVISGTQSNIASGDMISGIKKALPLGGLTAKAVADANTQSAQQTAPVSREQNMEAMSLNNIVDGYDNAQSQVKQAGQQIIETFGGNQDWSYAGILEAVQSVNDKIVVGNKKEEQFSSISYT